MDGPNLGPNTTGYFIEKHALVFARVGTRKIYKFCELLKSLAKLAPGADVLYSLEKTRGSHNALFLLTGGWKEKMPTLMLTRPF